MKFGFSKQRSPKSRYFKEPAGGIFFLNQTFYLSFLINLQVKPTKFINILSFV